MTASTVDIDDLSEPRLPPALVALNERVGRQRPLEALRPEPLLAQAVADTGLDDFGDDWFREPLEVLCRSLREEAGLSPLGALAQQQQLVQLLRSRLRVEHLIASHPEIEAVELATPMVIAGLPRSGTTFLHNLLAADPAARHLTEWESENPGGRPPHAASDPQPEDPFAALLDSSLPYLKRMLDVTPDSTHEEIRLLALSFASVLFETQAMLPGYRDWYLANDQRPAYAYLARALRAMQWLGGGGRWVLKTMQHVEQLPALTAAFPGATVVVTHRDPAAVVPSISTMLAYTQRLGVARVEPAALAGYWTERIVGMVERCLREHDTVPAGQIVDVTLADIRDDPDGVVRRVYDAAGVPLTSAALAAIRARGAQHHPHRYGRVRYDTVGLGVDQSALRRRTRAYVRRFGVPLETPIHDDEHNHSDHGPGSSRSSGVRPSR